MSEKPLLILGVAGSLRRASFNRGLLRAAVDLTPPDARIDVFDLVSMPPYNADVEAAGLPEVARVWKELIESADALLIANPEYNYSMSGVLKNAIDWACPRAALSPLRHKPIGLM